MQRPSQVKLSEIFVRNIIAVITEEYINPFDPSLNKDFLYNLSSGIPTDTNISDDILSVRVCGEIAFKEFKKERLESQASPFHEPITRQKIKFFSDTSKKIVIHRHTISSNREEE